MSDLVWRDPPAPQRNRVDWRGVARELLSRPGQWALVHHSPSEPTARSHASALRRGRFAAMTPVGQYEITSRGPDVYARFIGGGDPAATDTFKPYLPAASCGTEAGAKRHQRAGEPTCEPCRRAAGRAHVDRWSRKATK